MERGLFQNSIWPASLFSSSSLGERRCWKEIRRNGTHWRAFLGKKTWKKGENTVVDSLLLSHSFDWQFPQPLPFGHPHFDFVAKATSRLGIRRPSFRWLSNSTTDRPSVQPARLPTSLMEFCEGTHETALCSKPIVLVSNGIATDAGLAFPCVGQLSSPISAANPR